MNGLKVRDSKIEGKGLFADKEFNEGDIIGIAHINDVATSMIGRFHNHSDNPNAHSVSIGNKRYLAALRPLMKGEEITVDYRRQPELEQPEEFRKGGLVKMPKPSKKGLASKKYTKSILGTNRLFTKNPLYEKPKSKKNRVYDPNAKYYQDGGFVQLDRAPGNKFKKDAGGRWVYESGAPVTDTMILQELNYGKGKPIGSPAVQSAPKYEAKVPMSNAERKQKIGDLRMSPQISDQQEADRLFEVQREQDIYYPDVSDQLMRPPKNMNDLKGTEWIVNSSLGFPMNKARLAADAAAGPNDDPVDNFRHANAGRYTAEAIEDAVSNPMSHFQFLAPAVGFIGSNLSGVGHELMTLLSGRDDRDWGTKLRESGEDIYNNYVGSKVGASNMTPEEKTNYLLYLSGTNQLPDGIEGGKNRKGQTNNMYFKKGPNDPGKYKSSYQKGGESKKKKIKTDDHGRYRSEAGNVRTPITPEMRAVMPPDEWSQYIQDVPEVYTTRTKEEQALRNYDQWLESVNRFSPLRPTQSDAIQPANWVFAAPMVAPMALEALGSVAATQIPGTGLSVGTVANTGFGIHGATQVPQRIEDWQDVAAGKKDWREATAESLMTGLELYGGLSELKGFKGVPKELPGSPNTEEMVDLWRIQEKNAKTFAQLAEEGKIPKWFNNPETLAKKAEEEKYFGQWFTNSKKDLDWYMKDREFIDPEIIQLKVPKSKLPEFQNYDKTLSRAPEREFVIPLEQQSLYKYQLPGSPNNTANIQKAAMLNPLAIADAIVPRLPHPVRIPLMGAAPEGLGPFTGSPLNFIPGYGKTLGKQGNAFRKFGNTMEYVQDSKTLSPKGGSPLRIGKDQIVSEGNWAALDQPWENYPGTFAAEFDFAAPGSNLGYVNPSSRNGVLITDKAQNTLVDIPVSDPGLSFHRRLPFSNRYVPINKEKLLNNQFQLATQGGHFQSLVEKYGYGLAYAAMLGAMGNTDAVKKYNQYTIDPVIKEAKKLLNYNNK